MLRRDCEEQPRRKPGVLVVDDEKMIRDLLRAVLRHAGFDVWLAADGAEALDQYEQHQDAIAAVLLDVRMPGLDGPQTLGALQRLHPEVRCCFMTGDSGSYTRVELLEWGAVTVIAKPFRLAEVIEILWQLTETGRSRDHEPVPV